MHTVFSLSSRPFGVAVLPHQQSLPSVCHTGITLLGTNEHFRDSDSGLSLPPNLPNVCEGCMPRVHCQKQDLLQHEAGSTFSNTFSADFSMGFD